MEDDERILYGFDVVKSKTLHVASHTVQLLLKLFITSTWTEVTFMVLFSQFFELLYQRLQLLRLNKVLVKLSLLSLSVLPCLVGVGKTFLSFGGIPHSSSINRASDVTVGVRWFKSSELSLLLGSYKATLLHVLCFLQRLQFHLIEVLPQIKRLERLILWLWPLLELVEV